MFPSRTETFGNVILEALASGLPVASVPAPGPVDLIQDGVNGAIDDDLGAACWRAITCSRDNARASIIRRTLRAGHDLFRAHLVPARAELPFAVPAPTRRGRKRRPPEAPQRCVRATSTAAAPSESPTSP